MTIYHNMDTMYKIVNDIFYRQEDFPVYLEKISKCRYTYNNFDYKADRWKYEKELEASIKEVAFSKIISINSSDLVKSKAYFDAIFELPAIEKAFQYLKEHNPEVSNEILSNIEINTGSSIDDIIDCLVDIIEDPKVFNIFIKCDKIESINDKFREFNSIIENKIEFDEQGNITKESKEILKNIANDFKSIKISL